MEKPEHSVPQGYRESPFGIVPFEWGAKHTINFCELYGKERVVYGDKLLKRLEESLDTSGLNEFLFTVTRSFYRNYPQIHVLFSAEKDSTKSAMMSHQFLIK